MSHNGGESVDERELLAQLRMKNERALKQAIQHFSGYVAAVVRNTLGSQATAEDVEELISDVFVALWKNAPRLREDTSFKPWLAVVARNASLKWTRTAHSTEPLSDDVAATAVGDDDVVHSLLEREQQEQLFRALCELAPHEQHLVERHYLADESIGSIAQRTGMNQSTIKSQLFRSRKKLRNKLSGEEGGTR
jgi:RNA polymerase sigma-70 factor (ECF subfamily)